MRRATEAPPGPVARDLTAFAPAPPAEGLTLRGPGGARLEGRMATLDTLAIARTLTDAGADLGSSPTRR